MYLQFVTKKKDHLSVVVKFFFLVLVILVWFGFWFGYFLKTFLKKLHTPSFTALNAFDAPSV